MMHCAVCETIVIYFSGGYKKLCWCEIFFHALHHVQWLFIQPLNFRSNFQPLEPLPRLRNAYHQVCEKPSGLLN